MLHVLLLYFTCLQVGAGLLQHFKGQAAELIAAAGGSAVALVNLVTAHFPGFRDHAVYGGRQVRCSEGCIQVVYHTRLCGSNRLATGAIC